MQNLELTQYIQYIWMVPLVLFIVYVIRSPMFKGAYGEHRVNKALRGTLDSKLYHVLEDLTLPAGKGTTQIDHVVLSRFGIFVIETKNRRGWIFGNADQAKWTTVVYGRKFRIQNPLRQNYKHVKVVQELLSLRDNQIYNVIAFVGSGTPKTAMPPNVAWNMRSLLRFIESKQDVVLGSHDIDRLAQRLLDASLEPGIRTHLAHVKHVKKKIAAAKTKCPRCGAQLVERNNRKSGERFLGCSNFPKCKVTRKIA